MALKRLATFHIFFLDVGVREGVTPSSNDRATEIESRQKRGWPVRSALMISTPRVKDFGVLAIEPREDGESRR